MEKVTRHFIFCLLMIVAPFLPQSRESESFLIGRGTINSMNLSSTETFVGKSETLFSPTNHHSYHAIKNNHNSNNNNNNGNNNDNHSKNNQKNNSRLTLSRIYEDHEEGRVYGGTYKEEFLNFQRAHIVDKEKFQDVRKTHHPGLYYKLWSEDTPRAKGKEELGATSAKLSADDEVEQEEEDLNDTFKELEHNYNYQLDQQQYPNEQENERVSENMNKSLELDSDDWNSTLMNFRLKFPVKKWEAFGLFTEDYLNSINKHWLTFQPASPLSHHIMAILYIIIMIIGCSGNFLVVFMFCR